MVASEAPDVIQPSFRIVCLDVIPVSLCQPFDGLLDPSAGGRDEQEGNVKTHNSDADQPQG